MNDLTHCNICGRPFDSTPAGKLALITEDDVAVCDRCLWVIDHPGERLLSAIRGTNHGGAYDLKRTDMRSASCGDCE